MKLIEIKEEIHDTYFTFETSVLGVATKISGKENENSVIIPVFNLVAEEKELTKNEIDAVTIDKSFFLFTQVSTALLEGALHTEDRKGFKENFSKIVEQKESTHEKKDFELGGFGLLDINTSYDGRFLVESKKCFLVIPDEAVITPGYPPSIKLGELPENIVYFLLQDTFSYPFPI